MSQSKYGKNKEEMLDYGAGIGMTNLNAEMTNKQIEEAIEKHEKGNTSDSPANDEVNPEEPNLVDSMGGTDDDPEAALADENAKKLGPQVMTPTGNIMTPKNFDLTSQLRVADRVDKARKQKLVEQLEKEVRIMMLIPKRESEIDGTTLEVGINGVVFVYEKGQIYEVPQSIATLIMEHLKTTGQAGKDLEINRSEAHRDALS